MGMSCADNLPQKSGKLCKSVTLTLNIAAAHFSAIRPTNSKSDGLRTQDTIYGYVLWFCTTHKHKKSENAYRFTA